MLPTGHEGGKTVMRLEASISSSSSRVVHSSESVNDFSDPLWSYGNSVLRYECLIGPCNTKCR